MTKQLTSLFFRNTLSFALIFIALGFIVNGLLTSSLYSNIDKELTNMSQDRFLIARELANSIEKYQDEGAANADVTVGGMPEREFNHFQTQVILWNSAEEIANSIGLGNRRDDFENLKLDTKKSGQIETLVITKKGYQNLRFRSLLVETGNPLIPYAQLLSNTNPLDASLQSFQSILIACMLGFWLISLFVSYYLAKKNLEPVIKSWEKQQEFVENASHELRTPLAIIQAKLEKLFINPTHTIIEESEDIALALNEVKRLEQLTNGLLMLARSDSNNLVIHKEATATQSFVETVINPFKEIASLDDKDVIIEKNEDLTVSFDNNLLKQLLVILMDNALKYTQMGDTIKINSFSDNQFWKIEVIDTGIGVQTEDLSLLFERFYRDDEARQRKTGGHGLGLSIAKWIVTLHEGKIEAHHNKPKGIIFTISLPLKK